VKVTVEHRGLVQQNPDEDSFQVDVPATFNSTVTFSTPQKTSVAYVTASPSTVSTS